MTDAYPPAVARPTRKVLFWLIIGSCNVVHQVYPAVDVGDQAFSLYSAMSCFIPLLKLISSGELQALSVLSPVLPSRIKLYFFRACVAFVVGETCPNCCAKKKWNCRIKLTKPSLLKVFIGCVYRLTRFFHKRTMSNENSEALGQHCSGAVQAEVYSAILLQCCLRSVRLFILSSSRC